ncbi:hypothetical protein HMPREF2678_07320 [Corynebacterium sp. HMSC058E07]|nr:hypothetical protein HMPREF2678_07320 [Corynebacterium sp. HMSC058E07]
MTALAGAALAGTALAFSGADAALALADVLPCLEEWSAAVSSGEWLCMCLMRSTLHVTDIRFHLRVCRSIFTPATYTNTSMQG